jgi:PAS domain S-box-containing protein
MALTKKEGNEMEPTDLSDLDLSLSPPTTEGGDANGPAHVVQFYDDETFLLGAIGRFVGPALGAGEACLIIATAPHQAQIAQQLAARGFDLAALSEQGRYVALDAAETLSRFMVDGWPDEKRFVEVVGATVARAAAAGQVPHVHAFGEMVALLCAEGRPEAAIRLEELWNDLAKSLSFSLLCAYPLAAFRGQAYGATLLRICGAHSQAFPSEGLNGHADRLGFIVGPQEKAQAIETQGMGRELAQARLAAIVESSDDAIVSKSLDGIVTSWNPAAERMFGWTSAEAVGRHITLIIPGERRAEEDEALSRIRRGEMVDHFDTIRVTKDGRLLNISLTISPIRDSTGRIVGASKIARDVTEKKRLEAELSEKLLELADSDRRKDEFLAMLGHELRNPLSAVRNSVVTARLDPSRRDRALDIAYRQTDQLARLVDDLLDVARITRGRMTLRMETVRLGGVVERAVETTRDLVEARAHLLTLALPDEPLHVSGDPSRLEQVVVNLITNAAKYTEPGGRIEVMARREGEQAVLRVRDNGVGIAPEMLSRVFDLFAQAHRGPARVEGGLGIGLTVVQRLVELHGGRVEVTSEGLGRGAEFHVSFPCVPVADANPVPARSAGEGHGGPVRVLVVDDNADVAEGLMMLLELLGHLVRVAHDGMAALEAVRVNVPDLMLVDIGLPGMDGYELARNVRQDSRLKGVVLVALTGYGRDEDKRKAIEAGFDEHLVKPLTVETFQKLLGWLEARRGPSGATA